MTSETAHFQITGMICPQCEDELLAVLLHTRGILRAEVSYRHSCTDIEFDPAILPAEALPELLAEAGFPVGGNGKTALRSDLISAVAVIGLFFLLPYLMAAAPAAGAAAVTPLAVFLMGLVTGVHCIGMCGGIMLTQSNVYVYNAARLVGCLLAGLIFGALGTALTYTAELRSMLKTLCGALVVLVGLKQWGVPLLRQVFTALKRPCETPGRTPAVVGFLNAFMPCGTLSAVWLMSAASGSAVQGALLMGCFALGTMPAMLLFGSLGRFIPKRYNKYILRGSTVLILALGLRMLYTGLVR